MNVLSAQIEKLLNGVGIRGGRSLYILPSGLEIGIGPIHVNKSLLSKFGKIAKVDVGAVSINKVRFKLPLPWISPTTLVSISGLHIDVSNTTFAAAEQDIGDSPKLSANDGSEKVEPPKQGISPGAPNFVIFTILAAVVLATCQFCKISIYVGVAVLAIACFYAFRSRRFPRGRPVSLNGEPSKAGWVTGCLFKLLQLTLENLLRNVQVRIVDTSICFFESSMVASLNVGLEEISLMPDPESVTQTIRVLNLNMKSINVVDSSVHKILSGVSLGARFNLVYSTQEKGFNSILPSRFELEEVFSRETIAIAVKRAEMQLFDAIAVSPLVMGKNGGIKKRKYVNPSLADVLPGGGACVLYSDETLFGPAASCAEEQETKAPSEVSKSAASVQNNLKIKMPTISASVDIDCIFSGTISLNGVLIAASNEAFSVSIDGAVVKNIILGPKENRKEGYGIEILGVQLDEHFLHSSVKSLKLSQCALGHGDRAMAESQNILSIANVDVRCGFSASCGQKQMAYDLQTSVSNLPCDPCKNSCPFERVFEAKPACIISVGVGNIKIDTSTPSLEELLCGIHDVTSGGGSVPNSPTRNMALAKLFNVSNDGGVFDLTVSVSNAIEVIINNDRDPLNVQPDAVVLIHGFSIGVSTTSTLLDLEVAFSTLLVSNERPILTVRSDDSGPSKVAVHVGPRQVHGGTGRNPGIAFGSFTGINVFLDALAIEFECDAFNRFMCFVFKSILGPLSGEESAATVSNVQQESLPSRDRSATFSLSVTTESLDLQLFHRAKQLAMLTADKTLTSMLGRHNSATELCGSVFNLSLFDLTEEGVHCREAIRYIGEENYPVGWGLNWPACRGKAYSISPTILIRAHHLHVRYLNRFTLELTQYILDYLIPAVTVFNTEDYGSRENVGRDNASSAETGTAKTKREGGKRNDQGSGGPQKWTRLEVMLVDSICDLVESSESGAGALSIKFDYLDCWHDSAHGGCDTKSSFFQNGDLQFSVIQECLPLLSNRFYDPPTDTSRSINRALLAKNRNENRQRDGLRISVLGAELSTVGETNICGHDVDLHATVHLAETVDDDIIVAVMAETLHLSLTRPQYRTILAMIYGNFCETLKLCLPIVTLTECEACGGLHLPEQTCKSQWCFVDVLAFEGSLDMIESQDKTGNDLEMQLKIATLDFQNLNYAIIMNTDDTMEQNVAAKTINISSASDAEVNLDQKFAKVLVPLQTEYRNEHQLIYRQLSTWWTLSCEIILNETQIFGQGRTILALYSYFVDPIYTFPEDEDFPMEKYGLRVDVKAQGSMITLLRDFYSSESEHIHLALDLEYSHEWKQDVIKGPGMCNIGIDLCVNSLNIGFVDESPFLNETLILPIHIMLNQGYVVQTKANEQRREMSGTNLTVSRKESDKSENKEIKSNREMCVRIALPDIFCLNDAVQHLIRDFSGEESVASSQSDDTTPDPFEEDPIKSMIQSQYFVDPLRVDVLLQSNVSLFRVSVGSIESSTYAEDDKFEGIINFDAEAKYFNVRADDWEPVLELTKFKVDTLRKGEKSDIEVNVVESELRNTDMNINVSSNLLEYLNYNNYFADQSQIRSARSEEMYCFLYNHCGCSALVFAGPNVRGKELNDSQSMNLEVISTSDIKQRRHSTRGVLSVYLKFANEGFETGRFDIASVGLYAVRLKFNQAEDKKTHISRGWALAKNAVLKRGLTTLENSIAKKHRHPQHYDCVVDVNIDSRGQKYARVRSAWSVTNSCTNEIFFRFSEKSDSHGKQAAGDSPQPLEVQLEPGEKYFVPINLNPNSLTIEVRPNSSYDWNKIETNSKSRLKLRRSLRFERYCMCTTTEAGNKKARDKKTTSPRRKHRNHGIFRMRQQHSWHFQTLIQLTPIKTQVSKGQHRKRSKSTHTTTDIFIKPVMQLQNLLPKPLKYRLSDETGSIFAMGVLPPENTIPIHALNSSSDGISMQIFLPNYQWSQDVELKLRKDGMFRKELKPIDLLLEGVEWNDDEQQTLKCPDLLLQCKMTNENEIFVYCSYWIENCSGTEINIAPLYSRNLLTKLSKSLSLRMNTGSKKTMPFYVLQSKSVQQPSGTPKRSSVRQEFQGEILKFDVYSPLNSFEFITSSIESDAKLADFLRTLCERFKLEDQKEYFFSSDISYPPNKIDLIETMESVHSSNNGRIYLRHHLECVESEQTVGDHSNVTLTKSSIQQWGSFLLIGTKNIRVRCRQSSWSTDIELSKSLSNYVDLKVVSEPKSYQLSLQSHDLGGLYAHSAGIKFSPRFVLINELNERLYLRQGSIDIFQTSEMEHEGILEANEKSHPFHWPRSNATKQLCVRFGTSGSLWSGFFPLNVTEDFDLLMKRADANGTISQYILRVNIRQQGAKVLIKFRPEDLKYAPYFIKNETLDVRIEFQQSRDNNNNWGILEGGTDALSHFAWELPYIPHRSLKVKMKVHGGPSYEDIITLDNVTKKRKRLNQDIEYRISVVGISKVLTFVRSELSLKKTQSKRRMPKILTRLKRSGSTNRRARRSVVDAFRISQVGDVSTSSLHVHLPLLGISLIDDYIPEEEPNHVRQELVYLSLHAIHYYETLAGSEKRTGLSVGLMQADNQMEKSSYPIVFCQKQLARGSTQASVPHSDHYDVSQCSHCSAYFPWVGIKRQEKNPCDQPALHICFARDVSHTEIDYFDHINFSIAPLDVTIDEQLAKGVVSMALAIMNDRASKVNIASSEIPEEHDNIYTLLRAGTFIEQEEISSKSEKKMYCRIAYISGIFVRLSWGGDNQKDDHNTGADENEDDTVQQSNFIGRAQNKLASAIRKTSNAGKVGFLKFLLSLSHFEAAMLTLDLKEIPNYVGEIGDLTSKLVKHYTTMATVQVLKIFSKSSALGTPASVFGGVVDLVYKPAVGLKGGGMKGFKDGAATGVKNLISSSSSATFGVLGGAAKYANIGAAYLTFDKEYINAAKGIRDIDRGYHGLRWNLKAGGRAVAMGFFQGVTGIVTEPIKGAKMGGVKGFAKGAIKGVVGVPMKPIAGILHGVTKTSQGVKAYVDRSTGHDSRLLALARKQQQTYIAGRIRLPRSFSKLNNIAFRTFNDCDAMGHLMLKKVSHGSYRDEDMVHYLIIRGKDNAGNFEESARWLLVTENRILMVHVPDIKRLKNAVVSWMWPLSTVESVEVTEHRSVLGKFELRIRTDSLYESKKGPLIKEGGKVKTHKKRWFVASRDHISYDKVRSLKIVGWDLFPGSIDGVETMLVFVTTSNPHMLMRNSTVEITGFESDRNGLKNVVNVIDEKMFSLKCSLRESNGLKKEDLSDANVVCKLVNSSKMQIAEESSGNARVDLRSQNLVCTRRPPEMHGNAFSHAFTISTDDGSVIKSTKLNMFGKTAKGHHKKLLLIASTAVDADLWTTYLSSIFDYNAASKKLGVESSWDYTYIPTPVGLSEAEAQSFATIIMELL